MIALMESTSDTRAENEEVASQTNPQAEEKNNNESDEGVKETVPSQSNNKQDENNSSAVEQNIKIDGEEIENDEENKDSDALKTPQRRMSTRLSKRQTPKSANTTAKKKPRLTSTTKKRGRGRTPKKDAEPVKLTELGLHPDEIPLPTVPKNIPKDLVGRRISLVWELEGGKLEWGAGIVKKLRYKKNTPIKNKEDINDVVVKYDGDAGKTRNSKFDPKAYSTDPKAPVGSWCVVSLPGELEDENVEHKTPSRQAERRTQTPKTADKSPVRISTKNSPAAPSPIANVPSTEKHQMEVINGKDKDAVELAPEAHPIENPAPVTVEFSGPVGV